METPNRPLSDIPQRSRGHSPGGYNCLHQDLYGEVAFPLRLTCVLSRRGADYTGGESLLVEQRPRAESRGDVVVVEQGEALIFATRVTAPFRASRAMSA